MKILIAGGTGQIGEFLRREYSARGWEVRILTRHPRAEYETAWDGENLGPWAEEIDGADIVINLAGRTVNCRYTTENMKAMMDSRVHSTRVVGLAVARAKTPPKLWLQMSTATIYAHSFDQANDETHGRIGGGEPGAPAYWDYSIRIAQAWENELQKADTPKTRKIALRTAMVMSPHAGGIFSVLRRLVRFGLGGSVAGGRQYLSWIHYRDFIAALDFLIAHEEIDGPVNLASPGPLPQKEFMRELRRALHMPLGLPAAKWMSELGAFFLRTDTELILKSRRVVPGRLLAAGFHFQFPNWRAAVLDLV